MFGRWFRRLFGIFGSKADSLLDKIEDPRAALDQVIKDMHSDIQNAKAALGTSEIQVKRSRISQANFQKEAENFRASAERYMADGNEAHAKQMLRRAVEAEKASNGFREAADKLEIDIDKLRESIRSKELKWQEAKSQKHALLAKRRVNENLSKLNNGSGYTDGSNAFSEYDRISEKISDQSEEAHVMFTMSADSSHGDVIMIESSVQSEFDELKKKLGKDVPQLESQESKTSKEEKSES